MFYIILFEILKLYSFIKMCMRYYVMNRNILFMPSWYPTKENPISGSFFKEQAEILSSQNKIYLYIEKKDYCSILGFLIRILIKKNKIFFLDDNGMQRIDSVCYYLSGDLKIIKYINTWIEKKRFRKIKDFFCTKKIDVIYAVTAQVNAYDAKRISDLLKVPYVIAEHSPFPVPGTLLTEQTKKAIESADAFISISNDKTRQILMQNINIHPFLVGNMLDENIFQPVIRYNENHIFTILIVAAYNFYKDYETFLSAMALLKKISSIPFKINIVGYCPIKDVNMWNLGEKAFLDLVNTYGIMDICKLTPKVDRKDIVNFYQESDVFVMTSIQEGFPVSSLEAAACGLPVFATRCGGVEDFIDDKCGRLFNLQDYKSIAYSLKELIEGKISFDSEYIRNKVISNYGKQAFLDKMNKVFEETIEKYKGKKI